MTLGSEQMGPNFRNEGFSTRFADFAMLEHEEGATHGGGGGGGGGNTKLLIGVELR